VKVHLHDLGVRPLLANVSEIVGNDPKHVVRVAPSQRDFARQVGNQPRACPSNGPDEQCKCKDEGLVFGSRMISAKHQAKEWHIQ
jgi:hypothetical protein